MTSFQENLYFLVERGQNYIFLILDQTLDLDLAWWLWWLLSPIILAFVLPAVILVLLYLSALFLHVYKYRYQITQAKNVWDGARQTLSACWEGHGWVWHGYEVHGLDNIPDEGAALLVYYHGAIPVDFYYLLSKIILHKKRLVMAVGDKFLFKIPGWKLLMDVFSVVPGTLESCSQILASGQLLAIAPGGVREAQFSTEFYELIWGSRIGFAKVAHAAQVPIIPIFTQNIREAFRCVRLGRSLWLSLYNKIRFPLVPVYGNFPVKLRTYIGKPILPDPNISPEELARKTALGIEYLIKKHQRIPGSIAMALLDRINPCFASSSH